MEIAVSLGTNPNESKSKERLSADISVTSSGWKVFLS